MVLRPNVRQSLEFHQEWQFGRVLYYVILRLPDSISAEHFMLKFYRLSRLHTKGTCF